MLNRGDIGADVVAWQTFLRSRGYPNWKGEPLTVNGDFDDDTAFATMGFQHDNGLEQTAVLCPKTVEVARKLGWR